MARVVWHNFNGGLANAVLKSRYNLEKYSSLAQEMKNFIPQIHGSAKRREGSRFVSIVEGGSDSSRIIPFSFNTEEVNNFVLCFNDKNIKVYNSTQEVASFASPYFKEHIRDISYSQIGDVVYLAHKFYPLHKIERRGSSPFFEWAIVEVIFNTSLPSPDKGTAVFTSGPINEGQSVPAQDVDNNYKVSAVDINGFESIPSETFSAKGRFATDWIAGDKVTITIPTVTDAVEYNVYKESAGYFGFIGNTLPDEVESIVYDITINGETPTQVSFSMKPYMEGSLAELSNVTVYSSSKSAFLYDNKLFVYGEQLPFGPFGEIQQVGWFIISNVRAGTSGDYDSSLVEFVPNYGNDKRFPQGSNGTYNIEVTKSIVSGSIFVDHNFEPDVTIPIQEDWFPFEFEHPSLVGFHNQRLVLAGTANAPQTFFMSRAGDFENFRKSRPLQADDPVEFTIASGSIDTINWIISFGDLLLGTSGAEYKVSGSGGTGSAISANDISITPQSFFGSANINPLLVGNGILHAQIYGSRIRDMVYSLEIDGYAGNDLTVLAPNIFGSYPLKDWTFQQVPNSTVWCAREDGKLYSLTYMREQAIYAWAEHETDGKYISVTSVSGRGKNIVYALVQRGSNIILEAFDSFFDDTKVIQDARFLDSYVDVSSDNGEFPIPIHLDASKMNLFVDGVPYDTFNVTDNKVIFNGASVVTMGYPYESLLSMMPFNTDTSSGSTLGIQRTLSKIVVGVYRSVSGMYGDSEDFDKMNEFPLEVYNYDTAFDVYTGNHTIFISSGSESEENLYIGQNKALPLEITSISAVLNFNESME